MFFSSYTQQFKIKKRLTKTNNVNGACFKEFHAKSRDDLSDFNQEHASLSLSFNFKIIFYSLLLMIAPFA